MKTILKTAIFVSLSCFFMLACSPTDSSTATANAATNAAETVSSAVEATADTAKAVASEVKAIPASATVPASEVELTIYPSAEETKPLQVGDAMPTFSVQAVDGAAVEFTAGARDKPAMIVTFRGGWCPFCNTHLEELKDIVPQLSENGMEVFFFSGDRAEILYSGLKDQAEAVANEQQYTILSDANSEGASALGIAFKLPDEQVARMIDSPRRDLADGSIAKHASLSVPSVFMIGTTGNVEFVHTDPNYRVRISNDDLLAAAMAVLGK